MYFWNSWKNVRLTPKIHTIALHSGFKKTYLFVTVPNTAPPSSTNKNPRMCQEFVVDQVLGYLVIIMMTIPLMIMIIMMMIIILLSFIIMGFLGPFDPNHLNTKPPAHPPFTFPFPFLPPRIPGQPGLLKVFSHQSPRKCGTFQLLQEHLAG